MWRWSRYGRGRSRRAGERLIESRKDVGSFVLEQIDRHARGASLRASSDASLRRAAQTGIACAGLPVLVVEEDGQKLEIPPHRPQAAQAVVGAVRERSPMSMAKQAQYLPRPDVHGQWQHFGGSTGPEEACLAHDSAKNIFVTTTRQI